MRSPVYTSISHALGNQHNIGKRRGKPKSNKTKHHIPCLRFINYVIASHKVSHFNVYLRRRISFRFAHVKIWEIYSREKFPIIIRSHRPSSMFFFIIFLSCFALNMERLLNSALSQAYRDLWCYCLLQSLIDSHDTKGRSDKTLSIYHEITKKISSRNLSKIPSIQLNHQNNRKIYFAESKNFLQGKRKSTKNIFHPLRHH